MCITVITNTVDLVQDSNILVDDFQKTASWSFVQHIRGSISKSDLVGGASCLQRYTVCRQITLLPIHCEKEAVDYYGLQFSHLKAQMGLFDYT